MKCKNQGVQKSGCHNLNLVLGDTTNSCTRVFFFFLSFAAHLFFVCFFDRWKVLQKNVSKFSVESLSQNRWECRIESVKDIKFQAPNIRDTLVQLSKTSENPKIKSEAICLTTYEMENFEFLLGMNIWYDILFVVNSVSKIMNLKYIYIYIDHKV